MACICQKCGNKYKIDLLVDNIIWEKIKPKNKPKGSGLLCGSCIIKKLEIILDYSVFELNKK